MGKFSDLDLEHIDIDDNDLDPEGLKDFLADTEGLSENETLGLQVQCLISEINASVMTLERLIHRAKYYDEVIPLEDIEAITLDLRNAARDLQ